MINENRIREYFLDLVRIDSEAGQERAIADKLKADLAELGLSPVEDDAGSRVQSNSGNIIAHVKGSRPGAPPMMLCSHMDTVVPGNGVKPSIDGSVVHTDGTTILGADDKSGIAVIFEALRVARERDIPYGDLDLVFTISEEKGLLGARELDPAQLRAKFGLVFDSDEPGVLFTRAPAGYHMEWTITGVAAHAGVAPERGINAIKIASEAIATMRMGRLDDETTANIGIIEGGRATNIVAEQVVVKGEARSRNAEKLEAQLRHMCQCFEEAVARYSVTLDGKVYRAKLEPHIVRAYDAMNLSDDAPVVRLVQQAGKNLNQPVPLRAMGGACDANVFNGKGLSVANLGTGMRDIHTTNEWLDLNDLYSTGRLVLEMLKLHAEGYATA